MDINKIALIVSFCALILAVPLSVIGNLLTPRIREWYSTTSQVRLEKRIAELRERSSRLKEEWLFDDAGWAIYKMQSLTALVVLGCMILGSALVAYAALFVLSNLKTLSMTQPWAIWARRGTMGVAMSAVMMYLISGVSFSSLRRIYRKTREAHTAFGREELEKELDWLVWRQREYRSQS